MKNTRITRAALPALVAATSLIGTGSHAAPVPVSALYDDALVAIEQSVPEFAGVWVEDGKLVVSLTKPGLAVAAQARDSLTRVLGRPDLASLPVSVRPARFTFSTLKGWRDSITADVLTLPGAVLTDVDEQHNVVRVGVEDVAATGPQVRAIAAARGVPSGALVVEHADPITNETLSDPTLPAVGGLEIGWTDSAGGLWVCTLGFPAFRGGVHGFVTNSHCSDTRGVADSTVYRVGSSIPIGAETADPPHIVGGSCPAGRECRYSDSAFATVANTSGGAQPTYDQGRIAMPPENSTSWGGAVTPKFTITAESAPIGGERLTKVGRTTGRTSGNVTGTCLNVGVSGSNLLMFCQGQASYLSAGGDSGSPVFAITSGSNVALKAIHWGSGATFSPIGNIQQSGELGALNTCAVGSC